MKTIYYAIEQKIEIPDDTTEEEIEKIIEKMAKEKSFIWDYRLGLFYYN